MEIDSGTFEALQSLAKSHILSAASGKSTSAVYSELEARYTQPLQRQRFVEVLRYFRTTINDSVPTEVTNLDVIVNINEADAYRVEIPSSNSSGVVDSSPAPLSDPALTVPHSELKSLPMLQKKRASNPVDFKEYDLRINLKTEQPVLESAVGLRSVISDALTSADQYKVARLKHRFSTMSKDGNFRYDFTSIQQFSGKFVYGSDIFRGKLRSSPESYEVEIEYVNGGSFSGTDFREKDEIASEAKKLSFMLLGEANVLLKVIHDVDYLIPASVAREVMKEYGILVGSSAKDVEGKRIIDAQLSGGNARNQMHQDDRARKRRGAPAASIEEREQRGDGDEHRHHHAPPFSARDNQPPFIGPKPVTLTKENVVHPPIPGVTSVLTKYTVTEKADGERRLLFVSRDKKVYTIDDRLNVSFTGLVSEGPALSLLDGEYIPPRKQKSFVSVDKDTAEKTNDKINSNRKKKSTGTTDAAVDASTLSTMAGKRKSVQKKKTGGEKDVVDMAFDSTSGVISSMFMCFDMYFLGGKDVRDLPLLDRRNKEEAVDRIALATRFFEDGFIKKSPSDCACRVKKFYPIDSQAELFARANTIFRERDAGLFPYELDGLIFTPALEPVGGFQPGTKFNGGSWRDVLKWKPPEMNTIDFLVRFHDEDFITCKRSENIYRVVDLYVGRNIATQPVSILDALSGGGEAKARGGYYANRGDNKYCAVKFHPDGEVRNVHQAYLELDSDGRAMIGKDGKDEIADAVIVEFAYDTTSLPNAEEKDVGFNWRPLRIRHDKTQRFHSNGGAIAKTANDHYPAQQVWNSIHDPVTESMLRGDNVRLLRSDGKSLEMANQQQYYVRGDKQRKLRPSLPMVDFHNAWVKERHVLGSFAGHVESLFDVGSGEGGDIQKWRKMAGLKRVMGIDYDRHNIVNSSNGAYVRLAKKQESAVSDPTIVFFPLDASRPFDEAHISSLPNEEDRKVGRVLWGLDRNPKLVDFFGFATRPFDLVSCQFAVHYFFKDMNTLRTFANNVASVLRDGGFFAGTCLDGSLVDSELFKVEKTVPKRKKSVSGGGVRRKKTEPVLASSETTAATVTSAATNDASTSSSNSDPIAASLQGISDNGSLMWHVQKMYTGRLADQPIAMRTGHTIRVFIESIGHAVDEYLVDFELFNAAMQEAGMYPVSPESQAVLGMEGSDGSFRTLYEDMRDFAAQESVLDQRLKNALTMTDTHKQYSFLNKWFVYQKRSK